GGGSGRRRGPGPEAGERLRDRAGGEELPAPAGVPVHVRPEPVGSRHAVLPARLGAPPASPSPFTGTAFPRRSLLRRSLLSPGGAAPLGSLMRPWPAAPPPPSPP